MKNFTITILVLLLTASAAVIFWQQQQLNVQDIQESAETESQTPTLEEEEVENVQVAPEESAEGGVVESHEELLVGAWQNIDDPQSVITFEVNGTLRDVYAGGAINEVGSYQVFDDPRDIPLETTNVNGPFLRQSLGDEDYYYVIEEVTSDSLVLIYLRRGNTLEYARVSE